ncbi:MAG: hypothetical protein NVS4B12_01370 [Ktedonobacteraceae bacterium]
MAKMTRRAMLWATSAGVAALSGAAAVLVGEQRAKKVEAAAPTTTGATASAPLAVYVPDVTKGEVHVMLGEQEFVTQNADLVRQLLSMAH